VNGSFRAVVGAAPYGWIRQTESEPRFVTQTAPLITAMPVGSLPTLIGLPIGAPVAASRRMTVSSPLFVTHAEP
jgi:hypothetical protein